MKTSSTPTRRLSRLALAALLALGATSASAVTQYWSGTGTWNTGLNWGNVSGGPYNVAWNNATADIAVFEGTGGTVTIGANRNADRLDFNVTGYTLTAAAPVTITGTGGTNYNLLANVTADIGANVTIQSGDTSQNWNLAGGSKTTSILNLSGVIKNATANASNLRDMTVNVTGGQLIAGTSIVTGTGTTGSGSVLDISSGGSVSIANAASSLIINNTGAITADSSITISGASSSITFTDAGNTNGIRFGPNGGSASALTNLTGTVNLNGGTVTVNKIFMGGGYSGGAVYNAYVNLNGGTLKALANQAAFMQGLTSVKVQAGGAIFDTNGKDITVGQSLLADSVAGGLQKKGAGTLTLTGSNTFTGAVTLDAGTLKLGSAGALLATAGSENAVVFGASSTGILQLNGTNRVLHSLSSNIVPGTPVVENANVSAITLTVGNSANASSVFAGVIQDGTGGGALALAKAGTGSLTLSGINTYTGATNITAGTLELSGSGSINGSSGITINGSGATFIASGSVSPALTLTQGTVDGTGGITSLSVADLTGNVVANGNGGSGVLTVGTLAFDGAATVNLRSGSTSAPLATTTLSSNAAGTVTINPTATSWANGSTYDLISYGGGSIGGAGAGQFALGTVTGLNPRQLATFGNSGTALTLAITGDNPYWTGAADGNWNTSSTNWKLVTAGTDTQFQSMDDVLFDDNATGNTTIDINSANVSPSNVTFNNSALDYTLGSSGGFGISSGNLTKSGSGTLTINNANTYTGTTSVTGGTLVLAGSLDSTAISVGSGGTFTETSTGIISGTASFSNSGTTTLAGVNTYTGSTTVHAGVLRATTSASALGAGGLTLAGGDLQLANDTALAFGRDTTVTGNALVTSDTLAAAPGVTHTLGALSIGSQTLAIAKGGNATGGTAGIGFGATTLTGSPVFSLGSASTLTLGAVANGTNTATFTGAGQFAQSGIWGNGSGGITLDSGFSGAVVLNQANTYTGATTVNAGTLRASGNAAALGAGTLTLAGGDLHLANDTGLNFARNTTVTGNAQITSDRLTSGAGVTHTLGTLTIGAQTLTLAKGASVASGTASLTVGATTLTGAAALDTAGGTNLTLGALGGNFDLAKQGAGTLTLNAAATRTSGKTTVSGGVLAINTADNRLGVAPAAFEAGNIIIDGATINLNWANAQTVANRGVQINAGGATLIAQSGNYGFAGRIDGVGALTIVGTVGQYITGTNNQHTYSGGTILSTGTATVFQATSDGTGGGLTKGPFGTGTLTLQGGSVRASSAVASYDIGNAVSIEADTTIPTAGQAFTLSGAVTLTGSRTLTQNSANDVTISGAIGESAAGHGLTKAGAGKLVLSGTNGFTGATTVNNGTLVVDGSLHASSAVTVGGAVATGTPVLTGSGTVHGSLTVSAASGGAAGTVNPGSVGGIGTLAAGTTGISGTFAVDLNASTSDKLAVTGDLDISAATVSFNSLATPAAASYELASYTGTLTGSAFASTTGLPTGYEVTFDTTNKKILLSLIPTGGYDSWATTNGITGGAQGDFDNDGVKNGVEYFMGETTPGFTSNPTPDNTGKVTWPKDPAYVGTWTVETSPDLQTWTPVTATDNGTSVEFTLPTGQPQIFVHLVVTPD